MRILTHVPENMKQLSDEIPFLKCHAQEEHWDLRSVWQPWEEVDIDKNIQRKF